MTVSEQFSALGWPLITALLLSLALLSVALTPAAKFKHEWKIVIDLPLKHLIELIILCAITFLIGFSI
jgi:uncharacterized membrane protein